MSQSNDNNIRSSGINNQGNKWTSFNDGQYSYENYDNRGNQRSFYHNGGSSGINNYHDLTKPYSWYEDLKTGDTNRPTQSTQHLSQN